MISKTEHSESDLQSEPVFVSLKGRDVVTARVSDHHPIVHDNVLFWNMMMQGNKRGAGSGFNNGFGMIESDKQYTRRLIAVAWVIAETVYRHPNVEAIHLCEGPVKPKDLKVFYQALMRFSFMKRFMRENQFYRPDADGIHWGLLTLVDTRYDVTSVNSHPVDLFPKLTNRFQLLKLTDNEVVKYMASAHFPFAGDEHKEDREALSLSGKAYCQWINALLDNYSHASLILCADFNLNPYLISQRQERALDKIPSDNSILLHTGGDKMAATIHKVMVDGILLSNQEKQKYQTTRLKVDLAALVKSEYRFFQPNQAAVQESPEKNQESREIVLLQ